MRCRPGVDVCRIASHPQPSPVSRWRLDLCFQHALGDLSFFFFFFASKCFCSGLARGQRARKIWLWKTILIRQRSAGTEAGMEELFTSSELCQW